jgi:hypothetical protein
LHGIRKGEVVHILGKEGNDLGDLVLGEIISEVM